MSHDVIVEVSEGNGEDNSLAEEEQDIDALLEEIAFVEEELSEISESRRSPAGEDEEDGSLSDEQDNTENPNDSDYDYDSEDFANSSSDEDIDDVLIPPPTCITTQCKCFANLGHFPDHKAEHDIFTPVRSLAFTAPLLINELENLRPVSQANFTQVVWFIKALKRQGIKSIVRIDIRGLLTVTRYPGMPDGPVEVARDYLFVSSPDLEITRYIDYCHGNGQITHVELDYEERMSPRDVQIFMANLLDHGAHCDIISEVSPVTGPQPII